MGKYIRKGKITGGGAVMEVHHQPTSYLGVRTRARAKTLAATAAIKQTLTPNPADSSSSSSKSNSNSKSSSCYLQLRSRRLQKCLVPKIPEANPNPSLSAGGSKGSKKEEAKTEENEVSFGENVLEVEGKSSRAFEKLEEELREEWVKHVSCQ